MAENGPDVRPRDRAAPDSGRVHGRHVPERRARSAAARASTSPPRAPGTRGPRTRSGCSGGRPARSSSPSTSPRARSPRASASGSTATWARTSSARRPIIGHTLPVTRQFKGGRGVATRRGRDLRDLPACSTIAGGVLWGIVVRVTHKASVASITVMIALPIGGRARGSHRHRHRGDRRAVAARDRAPLVEPAPPRARRGARASIPGTRRVPRGREVAPKCPEVARVEGDGEAAG